MVLENLVDAILSNLADLMPFVIVKSYEEGCRWRLGSNPTKLTSINGVRGTGLHARLWIWHSSVVLPIVDDALMLPVQSVITKDEKLVCFRVSIGYRIADIVKHCCGVNDFIDSTMALAMQHLAKKVREKTLAELVGGLEELEKSLKGTLETKFKNWGTEVFSVGFVDFAEVPTQVRLFQDISNGARTL